MNLLKKPLQKIVTGGVLAAAAFVICAFFQLAIEADLPPELNSNSAHLSVINGLPVELQLKNSLLTEPNGNIIKEYGILVKDNIDVFALRNNKNLEITLSKDVVGTHCKRDEVYKVDLSSDIDKGAVVFITESICDPTLRTLQTFSLPKMLSKPEDGGAYAGIVFNIKNYDIIKGNGSFLLQTEEFSPERIWPSNITLRNDSNGETASVGYVPYEEVDIHLNDKYIVRLMEEKETNGTLIADQVDLKQGGAYIMVVYKDDQNKLTLNVHNLVKSNTVSMFWQILQYTVLTASEIMFSITGLEFSYSQAPSSMKSVLQAAWLMTVAFGNLIVAIIATSKIFSKQSYEFFFFAGLMVIDMFVFATMAFFYVPLEASNASKACPPTDKDKDSNEEQKTYTNGNSNKEELNGSAKHNGIANDGFNEEDTKF